MIPHLLMIRLSVMSISAVFSEMNDVVLNKTTTIESCLNRIHEVYAGTPENLKDFTKQDRIILTF